MLTGLLGRRLEHSYSPQIHSMLGDYEYALFEREEDELAAFAADKSIHAFNVTIPYKQAIMPYLEELSQEAKRIGCVNTVVRRADGTLYGDNTDIYGFKYMLKYGNIDVNGKKVLILGSGATSKTAYIAVSDLGAADIVKISRSGEDNYENIGRHLDAQVIINTTPVGMYPNNLQRVVDISRFKELTGVCDVVYNPAMTGLLMDAKRLGIRHIGGLPMLVAQAKRASEVFFDRAIEDGVIEAITKKLYLQMKNIVLIGMPGCGKSTIAKYIAKELDRQVIDADKVITERAGVSIPEIFANEGEEGFRRRESEVLSDICKLSAKVIATGGGCITREVNYEPMRQNSIVVYIKRDINKLAKKGRPLSLTTPLEDMFRVRKPLYERFCDFSVENNGVFNDAARNILKILKGE